MLYVIRHSTWRRDKAATTEAGHNTHVRGLRCSDSAVQTLARALGQPEAPIAEALALLLEHQLVTTRRGRVVATGSMTVDTRATTDDRRRLRAHWASVAAAAEISALRRTCSFCTRTFAMACGSHRSR